MEPQNYSYPTDSEPNHILSCPDWKEDLVKYKKERLHIPHKIITVPEVKNPSFKAPTYVEIPKTKRLFSQNKKNKKPSPTMGGSKPPYKLTITGSNITVHQYPKGSPQKSEETQSKVESVVKPVSEVSAIIKEENSRPSLGLKSSILSEAKSSPVVAKSPPPKLSLNIPKSPERNKTRSEWGGKPHGHASPKANVHHQHHSQHSPKTGFHGGGSGHSPKASLKHMSPLMKKVHKAMKQERQRMSCSGRSAPAGVVNKSPRSPVRVGSPFRASSPGRSPYRPESPVASSSTSGFTSGGMSCNTSQLSGASPGLSATPVHTLPGCRSPAQGTSEQQVPSPGSYDSAPSTPDICNMSSEELGYEKVKPKVASPFKHSVTSTANKLAERLGVSIDLKKKPVPSTENPFEKYRKMYKEQVEKQKQEDGVEKVEAKDEVEINDLKENGEVTKKTKKKKKKKDKDRDRDREKEKNKLEKCDSVDKKDFTIDDLKCLPLLAGKCKKNKGKDLDDSISVSSTCSSQKAKKRKHRLLDDSASVASSCSEKSCKKKKKKVPEDNLSLASTSSEPKKSDKSENPKKKKDKMKKNAKKDKVNHVSEKSKKNASKDYDKSGKEVKGNVGEVKTNPKESRKSGNKNGKERSLPSTPTRKERSQPSTPTRATRCKSEAPGTPKTPKGTPKRLTKLGQELRKNVLTPKSKAKKEREKREEEERRKKLVGDRRRKRRSMLDELWSSDGYVAEKRFRKNNDLLADPSELGREERALQVRHN